MSKGDVKIDQEKYKHNESYRIYIQNYFKDDLVQPFINGLPHKKNPEFIKRYGEKFYKEKPKVHAEEEPPKKNKRVILGHSKWSQFYP